MMKNIEISSTTPTRIKVVLEGDLYVEEASELRERLLRQLETIEMIMINDPNTELSMFDNGELDWAGAPTGALPTDAMQL